MLNALLFIYLFGALCGLYCAKKYKDPPLFYYAFIPIVGTYFATKAAIRIFIEE